jgi:hypothetical protein
MNWTGHVPPPAFQPRLEILNLDRVLHGDARHRHPDGVQALGDGTHPLLAANRSQPERDRLVEGGRRDLHGVIDSVSVTDRDAA